MEKQQSVILWHKGNWCIKRLDDMDISKLLVVNTKTGWTTRLRLSSSRTIEHDGARIWLEARKCEVNTTKLPNHVMMAIKRIYSAIYL